MSYSKVGGKFTYLLVRRRKREISFEYANLADNIELSYSEKLAHEGGLNVTHVGI